MAGDKGWMVSGKGGGSVSGGKGWRVSGKG